MNKIVERYGPILFVGIVPVLLFFYPIFLMVKMSFFVEGEFAFSNYIKFFSSKMFFTSFVNSIQISIVSTLILSVLGLFIVIIIRDSEWAKKYVRIISSLPLVFSSYIFCISLIYTYGRAGIVTHIFSLFGIDFPIHKILYSRSGIVFASVVYFLPYFIIPLFSSFEELNTNLEEVAESLGSRGFHKFRNIIFPQIKYGFFVGVLISFLLIFNQISIVIAMGVGKVYTLTYLLYAQYERSKFGMANTIATVSLIFSFFVSVIFQRFMRVIRK